MDTAAHYRKKLQEKREKLYNDILDERRFLKRFYKTERSKMIKQVSADVDKNNDRYFKFGDCSYQRKNDVIEFKKEEYGYWVEKIIGEFQQDSLELLHGLDYEIYCVNNTLNNAYVFYRISDSEELITYYNNLIREKESLENKISSFENRIDKPTSSAYIDIFNKHYYMGAGEKAKEYLKYLSKEFYFSESFLNLAASLLTVEYEITELSTINSIIDQFLKSAKEEFDEGILKKLSDYIFNEYRYKMLQKYETKKWQTLHEKSEEKPTKRSIKREKPTKPKK